MGFQHVVLVWKDPDDKSPYPDYGVLVEGSYEDARKIEDKHMEAGEKSWILSPDDKDLQKVTITPAPPADPDPMAEAISYLAGYFKGEGGDPDKAATAVALIRSVSNSPMAALGALRGSGKEQ